MLGGLTIQIGSRNFTEGADARSLAMWEGAVQELEERGLISPLGNKREIFKVTRDGFDAADYFIHESYGNAILPHCNMPKQ